MKDFTYPIELLKKEIDNLNDNRPPVDSGVDGLYHHHKTMQVFEAIELLQKAHMDERK